MSHRTHNTSKPQETLLRADRQHPSRRSALVPFGRTCDWALVTAVAVLLAISRVQADFHVAPTGSDSNPGTEPRPFCSPERAREAVRALKRTNNLPPGGLTVWLHGGDYIRTNTLDLSSEDSGTPTSPIVWRAVKDSTPRFLGGRILTGFGPVTDTSVLSRLDANARTNVVQLNLRSLGITDFGPMKSRGFGRSASVAHPELFHGGHPMTLARWPNAPEFALIAGYPPASDRNDEHGGKLGELPGGFNYDGDRPTRWQDTGDLWVHGYWAYDWANSYEKVALLDREQKLVKTAPPHGNYGFRKGQRFYFLNVLEEIDQPGEWFLDGKTGNLYFWPPNTKVADPDKTDNQSAKRRIAPAPKVETLLSVLGGPLVLFNDVSHLTLQGIVFEATRGNAIEIRGGSSNRVAGCVIRNIGNSGVVINGGIAHGVVSCDIFDTGDGGVSLTGGDRQALVPACHFVENCHFQRQGRWSKCYVPAVHLQGVGMRVWHNLIHDHPHCAILFWGNDHLIEFNEIHHIALETGDVGAIYTGRDYTFRGNRIRHNFIHHTGGVGMGSMGVYMDDCVSGTEVFGNLFYKVHWAMFIGGGRDHRVENNLFVDCDPAVRVDGRGLDRSPVWRNMVNDFMRRRLNDVPLALYRERYPEMKSLDRYYGAPGDTPITGNEFQGVPPENNLIARNVCVGKWIEAGWHSNPGMLLVENNLTNAAPSLAKQPRDLSPATDFELKNDSPAWRLGFQRIPVDRIGLHEDDLRRSMDRLNRPWPTP